MGYGQILRCAQDDSVLTISKEKKLSELTLETIRAAHERIKPHIHRTPVFSSSILNKKLGAEIFFKCENMQKVGAFKARGACNAVMSLTDDQARRGVVTHSSGNHGAALAMAAPVIIDPRRRWMLAAGASAARRSVRRSATA